MSLEISKSLTHRSGLEGSVESTLLSSCFASCSRGYLKRWHKGCNLEKKLTTSSLRRCISLLLTLCCQTVGLRWHQKGPSWAGRGLGTGQQVTGALWGLWGGRKASASGGSEVLQLLGHNVQLWVLRSAQALQKMHKVVWVVGKNHAFPQLASAAAQQGSLWTAVRAARILRCGLHVKPKVRYHHKMTNNLENEIISLREHLQHMGGLPLDEVSHSLPALAARPELCGVARHCGATCQKAPSMSPCDLTTTCAEAMFTTSSERKTTKMGGFTDRKMSRYS